VEYVLMESRKVRRRPLCERRPEHFYQANFLKKL